MQDVILDTLHDGDVVLYLRPEVRKPVIQYRIKLPGQVNKYERRSTGSEDISAARQIAEERFQQLGGRHKLEPAAAQAQSKTDDVVLERLREGDLVLYLRPKVTRPVVQYRIRIPGEANKYERRSTGHTDLKNAREIAERRFDELMLRQRQGVSVFAPTFDQMADSYLRWIKQRGERRKISTTRARVLEQQIKSYMKPFFKRKTADAITRSTIRDYHQWRRDIWAGKAPWPTGAVPRNVKREYTENAEVMNNSTINQIFKHALEEGKISNKEMPVFPKVELVQERRGYFNAEQIRKIFSDIQAQIDDCGNSKRRLHSALVFHHYTTILLHTGMRVGELRNLRWCDVEAFNDDDGVEHYELHLRGKTGKRRAIGMPPATHAIKALRVWYEENCRWKLQPEESVILEYRRKPAPNYAKRFGEVLGRLNMRQDAQGNMLSLYSLRHAFITNRLLERTDIHLLSRNCGTSVKFIETNYSHMIPRMRAKDLIGVVKKSVLTDRNKLNDLWARIEASLSEKQEI